MPFVPGGFDRMALIGRRDRAEISYLQQSTRPGEPFWAFPNEPLLNFVADRPLPNRFGLGLFVVTRAQRFQLVEEVERSRPALAVLSLRTPTVDGIGSSKTLPEVAAYFQSHYASERAFGSLVAMRGTRR